MEREGHISLLTVCNWQMQDFFLIEKRKLLLIPNATDVRKSRQKLLSFLLA